MTFVLVEYNRRNFHRMTLGCMIGINSCSAAYSIGVADDTTADLFRRSGDDDLDRALIAELKRMVHVLEINPGFKYNNTMNAWSTPKTIVDGTNGTVILGLPLIRKLIAEDDGGASVAGVCAHECGHIYQFVNGLAGMLRSDNGIIYLELHADFIAGYYMGRRPGLTLDQIRRVSITTYNFGDFQYKSFDSHGSPGQRSAALEKGYRTGLDGIAMTEAANIGISYVKNL